MGVHGLWDIVGPGGRRVPIGSLEGRTVAVDASIWVAQFVKAMRDANGDMLRGAHLVGFFRRLCKLYYYKMRPIIVFDGPPPALKKRTLRARRLRREQEEEVLQKAAEKLVHQIVHRKERRANISGANVTIQDVISGNVQEEEDDEIRGLMALLPKEDRPSPTRSSDIAHTTPRSSDEDVLQLARERRRVREHYYSSIPENFRGLFEHRRRLEDLNVPSNLTEILRPNTYVEDKESELATVSQEVTEFKELHLSDDSAIQIPLDSQIDETVFRALPPKIQYKILLQLKHQELITSRKRIVAAAAEPDVFSIVQMESYLRQLKTNEEIDKVKKKVAAETMNASLQRDDPLAVDDTDDFLTADEPGSFMQYYELNNEVKEQPTTTSFEESILKDLEEQKKRKREEIQRRESGHGKGAGTKRLKLFNEWAEQQLPTDRTIVERAKSSWWHSSTINESKESTPPTNFIPEELLEDEIIDLNWDEALTNEAINQMKPDISQANLSAEALTPIKHKVVMRRRNDEKATPPDEWGDWEQTESKEVVIKDDKTLLAEIMKEIKGEEEIPAKEIKVEEIPAQENAMESALHMSVSEQTHAGGAVTQEVLGATEISAGLATVSTPRIAEDARTEGKDTSSLDDVDAKIGEDSITDSNTDAALESGDDTKFSSKGDRTASAPIRTSNESASRFVAMSEKQFEQGLRVGEVDRETLEEDNIALLRRIRRSKERSAEASTEMMQDIRELLRCMGIPYVDAPSEAEAQAVELCKLGLAELVISDDSDSLVFGGKSVIRHMFDSDTTVELYDANEITRLLGLRVEELRALAMLLGCDYTLGIKGVGVVNALEIIQAYGSDLDSLRAFTKWARCGRGESTDGPGILAYQKKHMNYRVHWEFPSHEQYPSPQVMEAFGKPKVNKSSERFHWIVPDIPGVMNVMRSKGYISNEDQVYSMLAPVIERFKQPARIQQLITDYMPAIAQYKSERLKNAIKIIQDRKENSRARQAARSSNTTG